MITGFGGYVTQLRTARAMTKAAFARAVRVTWATVNEWELHGRIPDTNNLGAIAEALKASPTERARLYELAAKGGAAMPPPGLTEPAPAPPDHRERLDELLARALAPGRHTVADAHAVLEALAASSPMIERLAAPELAARAWLDAAAALRKTGQKVTAGALAMLAADPRQPDAVPDESGEVRTARKRRLSS